MSAKSIKFEISLEKLSVKFEGDIQTAERLQGEITGALNTLVSAQQKMLAPAPRVITNVIAESHGVRRRRRRKGGMGIDPSILDTETTSDGDGHAPGNGATRRVRASGGATPLLTTLKTEGFFGSKRTISDIRAALGKKGHTYKSNEISPTLTALTRDEVLKREKDEKNHWVYFTE